MEDRPTDNDNNKIVKKLISSLALNLKRAIKNEHGWATGLLSAPPVLPGESLSPVGSGAQADQRLSQGGRTLAPFGRGSARPRLFS